MTVIYGTRLSVLLLLSGVVWMDADAGCPLLCVTFSASETSRDTWDLFRLKQIGMGRSAVLLHTV